MKSVNRYIGMMSCDDRTAYVMARVKEIPADDDLERASEIIGYHGPDGRSYLYRPPKSEL